GTGFNVNTIMVEFYEIGMNPMWEYLNIQLSQHTSSGNFLIGSFGNAVVDPTLTLWSGATSFVDFSPVDSITLAPFSQYSVVLSVPTDNPTSFNLLFTSATYTTPTDWTMGRTTSDNPSAGGENLVMAVDATAIPEPGVLSLFGLGGLAFLWQRR